MDPRHHTGMSSSSSFGFMGSRSAFGGDSAGASEEEAGFGDILDEFNRIQKQNAELTQAVRLEQHRRREAENDRRALQERFNDLSSVILEKEKQLSLAKTSLDVSRQDAADMKEEIQSNRARLSAYEDRFGQLKDQLAEARAAYIAKLRAKVADVSAAMKRTQGFFLEAFDFDAKLLKNPEDVDIDFDAYAVEDAGEEDEGRLAEDIVSVPAMPEATELEPESTPQRDSAVLRNQTLKMALDACRELKRKYYGQLSHLKSVLHESYSITVTIDAYETDTDDVQIDAEGIAGGKDEEEDQEDFMD